MNGARLTPDQEREIQSIAGASARRNRPTILIVISMIALIVAVGFMLISAGAARAARADLDRIVSQEAEVRRLAREIELLREHGGGSRGAERYGRELQLSKLEAINQIVRLDNPPTLQEQRPTRPLDSPIERRRVDVTIDNAPLEAAFEWINEAHRAIPDLFISAIEMRPRPTGWTVRVQLSRWELRS